MCDQRTRCGRVVVNDPTRIDMNACATLSLANAALVLGIHRSTASELYRRGEFPVPVLQIGHRCRVTKIHLEKFLLAGTAEA
jgi:predicted DNA-binding transcriptional regulator AlpA